jgi:hypothetical protein
MGRVDKLSAFDEQIVLVGPGALRPEKPVFAGRQTAHQRRPNGRLAQELSP